MVCKSKLGSFISVVLLSWTVFFSVSAQTNESDRPLHILISDDEEALRELLQTYIEMFAGSPIKIFAAASGGEMLAILEKEKIDLVISDNTMPVMGRSDWLYGHEVLKKMREDERFKKIPFFMHSTDREVEGRMLSTLVQDLGGNGMIKKPIEAESLQKMIPLLISKVRKGDPLHLFGDCISVLLGLTN